LRLRIKAHRTALGLIRQANRFHPGKPLYRKQTHDDFKKYCEAHPDSPVVEIDSVLGGIGDKVLLTIHLNNCGLMFAFLRNANNSLSVINIFNLLEERFTLSAFQKLFTVILTDNCSEFSNPTALEMSSISV
jgi:hypothetical protein